MSSSSLRDRKLRIAICHPDLGIGGAERLIVDAAEELATRGHHVHIFTAHYDPNRCFDETKQGNFLITVYGDFLPRHIFCRLHAVFAYLRCLYVAVCMICLWSSFDIVLVDQVSAVVPLFKCTVSKVIFYCHFPDLLLARHVTMAQRLYRRPIDWLEEKTTGMADCVLVNSKFTASTFASTFKSLDAKGIKPQVLYPSVNIDQFDFRPVQPQVDGWGSKPNLLGKLNISKGNVSATTNDANRPFFLSINRFERKKNIGLAISAFDLLLHHLKSSNQDGDMSSTQLKLVIAGGYDERLKENQEYLRELKDLADEKGISERVVFMPSCSTERRNQLLAQCLCLIYTPADEHFGIVPLEAMAAQKPVIACNSGGPKESVVHNATGFLCEPIPQSFSSAMSILLGDLEVARKMGVSARERVKTHFSRHVFGQNLEDIAFRILN